MQSRSLHNKTRLVPKDEARLRKFYPQFSFLSPLRTRRNLHKIAMKFKIYCPVPDRNIVGKEALELLQSKSAKDRRIFNKHVQRARKGKGIGISRFATYDEGNETIIDLGITTFERIAGVEFVILQYRYHLQEIEGIAECHRILNLLLHMGMVKQICQLAGGVE